MADIQQKAQAAATSQISILAQTGETMQEAAKEEQQSGDKAAESESSDTKPAKNVETETVPVSYTPVDIYL